MSFELLLTQTYTTKDGLKVINSGSVVICSIEHRVIDGFVFCNKALNHQAWDTTNKITTCPACFPPNIEIKITQLKLFE